MEDNELRDIILEKSEDKKSVKIKKLLMLIAMFFILFLIVLIAMKIINSDDSNNMDMANKDARLVLPPEPEISKDNKAANDELFQQVPIIPESKGQDSFEDMVKSLKDKETQRQTEQPVATNDEPAPNVQDLIKQQNAQIQPQQPAVEPKHESKVTPKEQPKVVPTKPKEQTRPAPKDEQKQIAKEQVKDTKPKEHAKSATKPASQIAGSGGYIQIAAVRNFSEDTADIRKLKAHGYSYKLHKVVVNGVEMTKIIVGPYSKDSIKSELAKIKSNVASGAFVINIK